MWSLAVGLSGMAFVVAIVCAAVPTAMNGYVLARQMGGDAPMLATTTTLQTFLSALTVPALIWLAQLWRG
jgi:predicted permease